VATKKHRLSVAIQEDFCLLGMVSDDPDYKICWALNQALDMDFKKQEDLKLYHKRLGVEQYFSLFAHRDEDALLTYRIIKNQSDQGWFLDELKNLDYLIHIQGEIAPEKIDSFLKGAGSLPPVRMCIPVDLKKLRNQQRLWIW
jgi:hypothetical protein